MCNRPGVDYRAAYYELEDENEYLRTLNARLMLMTTHTTNIGITHAGPEDKCEWCVPHLRIGKLRNDVLHNEIERHNEIENLRTALKASEEERCKMATTALAECDRLRASNKTLLEAAQNVWAAVARTDDHTEWFEPLAKLHAAIAKAKGKV